MTIDSATNGNRIGGLNDGSNSDVTSKRHPRWTRQETLALIQAKVIADNTPHKGKRLSSSAGGAAGSSLPSSSPLSYDNTKPKWVVISNNCKKHGVERSPAQCSKRYTTLMHDFKKVKSWEATDEGKAESFWKMRNDLRKERKLPLSFDIEVYKVLLRNETGAAGTASPFPIHAVATDTSSPVVSDDAIEFFFEEGKEEDELDEEDIQRLNDEQYWLMFKADEQVAQALGWNLEDIKSADNVTESHINSFFSSEPVPEEQQHLAFQELNRNLKQDAPKESWPSFSNWTPQDQGKRLRLSTDDHIPCSLEAQIVRVLEANNKLMSAQLDSFNKNCQLDREQRKENNSELMATLSKLTDVLTKLADKL